MQFSDATNKNGLVQDIDFLCDTDSVSYTIEDKTRNINEELYQVGILMWKHSPLWNFDDINYTDHSIAVSNLVDGQADYSLPTTLIYLERVSVKDASGLWFDLIEKYYDDLPNPDEYMKTAGLPRYFAKRGGSIWLFPKVKATDVTLTAGLKLYLTRLAQPFVKTDTTKEPGFSAGFHRLLSLGASEKFLLVNNPDRYNRVKLEHKELEFNFIEWLKSRQREDRKIFLSSRYEKYE